MARRSILLASGLLVISMVATACGGSSATPTPPPAAASVAPGGAAGLPSLHPDTDLTSLFPKSVGGAPLTVTSMSGRDMTAAGGQNSEVVQAQVMAFVASQGKTIDDLSVAFGGGRTAEGQSYAVQAYRLKGADANALLASLLPLVAGSVASPQTSQVQVAGKTVTQVSNGPASASSQSVYFYPRNDVVWVVTATDPTLTEIVQLLP